MVLFGNMAADAEEEKATAGMVAKAEQVMSAMMADDMEDLICGECDAEEENNDDDGWDGFDNGCDDKLCFFCQKEPILKNQIFGAVCASDVRGKNGCKISRQAAVGCLQADGEEKS